MSTSEDKIRDFVTAREGEVEGLSSFEKHVMERSTAFRDNVERVQLTSSAILSVLDRINVSIDSHLLKLDATSSETLSQQLLDVLTEVRRSIRSEEQAAVREFGFVYGSLNTVNEVGKTIGEKIASARASVENQKTLLERAERNEENVPERKVGERPVSLKDERAFNQIVSNDKAGE